MMRPRPRDTMYAGSGTHGSTTVLVKEGNGPSEELTHIVHHSPSGFSWGYCGSGPAELARCILWDYLDTEPHPALYQEFKERFVASWPFPGDWTLRGGDIDTWLASRHPSQMEIADALLDAMPGAHDG